MQQIARANLIFGLHVHVGIPDREEGNRYYESSALFPATPLRAFREFTVLARTEHRLESYRQMIFERFPRTGIPDAFDSLSEYEDYLEAARRDQLHR